MKPLFIFLMSFFSLVNAQIRPPVNPPNPPNPPAQQGVIQGVITVSGTRGLTSLVFVSPATSTGIIINPAYTVTTDAEGKYRIGGLAVGKYHVATMPSPHVWANPLAAYYWYGNTNDRANAKIVEITESNLIADSIDIDIALFRGRINGRVLDKNGNPVENAQISAMPKVVGDSLSLPYYPNRGGYTYTMIDGSYSMDSLPEGEYVLQVSANVGFQYDQRYYPNTQDYNAATLISITEATPEVNNINFNLAIAAGTASISGRINLQTLVTIPYKMFVSVSPYYPMTADSLANGFGSALIWGGNFNQTIVNPDGTYTIKNVDAGKYIVSAYAYGQGNETDFQFYQNTQDYLRATPIEVVDAQNVTGIDFSLNPQNPFGSISGKITTSNGAPVEGAYVNLGGDYDLMMGNPGGFYRPVWGGAMTDANGEYKIEMVYKGDYTLKAHLNGASVSAKAVVNGDQNTVANFTLNPPVIDAKIMGKVTEEESGNGLASYVVATDAQNGATFFDKTDDMGNYQIKVPSGTYTLFAWSFRHLGEYYDNTMDATMAKPVLTSATLSANNIDFSLPEFRFMPPIDSLGFITSPGFPDSGVTGGATGNSTGKVMGVVKDTQGKGLDGATVYVYDASGKAVSFGRTDISGNYSIEGLPEGDNFKFHASATGFDGRYSNGATTAIAAETVAMSATQIRKDFELSRKSSVAVETENPTEFTLSGNYPNPFSNETQISFSLPEAQKVTIRVIDITGREVLVFAEMQLEAGSQKIKVEGNELSVGTYFYRIETNKGTFNGKMTIVR